MRAMVEVAAERGYAGASVELVVAQVGVSRRTFYACFESREAPGFGRYHAIRGDKADQRKARQAWPS
jgi:AcrR family transcriptional regulator